MSNEIKEMIERVIIQRDKTVDDMILGEIRKIATENGIDTIVTLNDKAIIQALKNFVEAKRGRWKPTNDNNKKRCSRCDVIHLIAQYPNGRANYCYHCGAKMDGGEQNEFDRKSNEDC